MKMKRILCGFFSLSLLLCCGCGQSAENAAVQEISAPEETVPAEEEAAAGETAVEEEPLAWESDPIQASLLSVVCEPTDIVRIGDGDFLVTDAYGKLVYRVKDGETSVFAGRETAGDLYGEPVGGYYDASNESSFFGCPWAIVPFEEGYAVSDTANSCVRFISEELTETITGNGTSGSDTGNGILATFDRPTGLAVNDLGNLYVADTGSGRLCLVNHETGEVSLLFSDLNEPTALCWKDGILYICESGANRILAMEKGRLSVIAGSGTADLTDGPAKEACFNNPMGITVSDNGTIYVSDTGSSAVRMIKDGEVTTVLQPEAEAMETYPAQPAGLLWSDGLLYVCDTYANMVYTIPAAE